jgi:hypothetical protein
VTSTTVAAIKGRVIRVIKLDACGNVPTGTGSAMVVADGFISVKNTPQYEDGTEFTQKRADGLLCVNQKDPGQFKRLQAEAMWCVTDPDIRVIMEGARLLTSGGVTGIGAAFNDSLVTNRFSIEIWQNVAGRNACNSAGQQQYLYWAFPNCGNAQVQDFTVENDVLQWHETYETQGLGQGASGAVSAWGAYPTAAPPNTYLGSGNNLQISEHYAFVITTTAPPAPTGGAITVT